MIEISKRTQEYSATRLIKAIRRATGVGLKAANDMVAELNRGEVVSLTPLRGVSDEEVSQWLSDCGVAFSSSPTQA